MDYCYTTLVASDDYIYGALGLSQSLKKVQSKYPLLILITDNCSSKVISLCEQFNILYKKIPLLTFTSVHPKARYSVTRSKIYIAELIAYKKICFLDADTLVLKNLDKFLEDNTLSYFFAYRIDHGIDHYILTDGSFIIFTPNISLFNKLLNISADFSEDESMWTSLFPYNLYNSIFNNNTEGILYLHFRENKYWQNLDCDWYKIQKFLNTII